MILLLVSGIRYLHRQTKIKWARELALPRMQNWVHDWDLVSAFKLRQEVKKYAMPKNKGNDESDSEKVDEDSNNDSSSDED